MPTHPAKPSAIHMQARALQAQAESLRAQGRIVEALEPTRRVALLLPDDARVMFNLGLNCFEAGRVPDSVSAFRRALTLQPRFAEAAWRLGLGLGALGDMEGSIAALLQAVDFKPSHVEARLWLARLLLGAGRVDDAKAHLKRARSSGGNTGLGWLAEARLMEIADDRPGVERAARRAMAVDPKNPLTQELMGHVHAEAGRFAEAEQCFLAALALNPKSVGAWYDVARGRRFSAADAPLVERMRAATTLPGIDPPTRAMLFLGLAKVLDDLDDPGGASEVLDTAARLRAGWLKFDLAAWRRHIEAIMARFTPEVLCRAADMGSPDETPLLILGMPRSGTTLVEQILSSHPQVTGAGELTFWRQRTEMMAQAGEAGLEVPFVSEAAEAYLAELRGLGPGSARVIDKLPWNYLHIGLIHLTFPRATIIHCRRRPIDTALSVRQTWFAQHMVIPTGGEDLVGYYRAYETLMDHWRRVLPAGRLIEVDYEALTAAPEPEIRRLVAAAGLPWDDACLHPEMNDRVVKTASKWQVRQPVNTDSIDRWRRFEPWLGPLAALLDESPAGGKA